MPASPIQFDEFSLDCDRYELLRSGRPIKLEKIPMELLILLASKDGNLVTRQEIIDRLWGKDVFVDTEHGINTAIRKIRKALRDDPEQPRFVLTVTGKGYRFVRPLSDSNGRHSEHGANGNGSGNGSGAALALTGGVRDTLVSVDEPVPEDGHVELASLNGNVSATALRGVFKPTGNSGMRWSPIALVVAGVVAVGIGLVSWRAGTNPALGFHVARYTQLTHDGLSKSQNPVLVNDGSRIYFSEETDSGFVIGQVPVNGGEVTRVPLPFEDKILGICDLSPDRTEFLLSSWRGWWREDPLWAMPTTGGPARRIGNLQASFAAWSPDRNSIFYSTEKGLYRAKTEGSDPQLLLPTKGLGGPLRISPDGKTMRFETIEQNSDTHHYWEASAVGSDLHLLFPDDNQAPSCCGTWSADGKDFFFNREGQVWAFRERSNMFGKAIFGESEPAPVELTNGPIQYVYPSSSSDGHRIFAVGTQLRGELMRYDSKADQFVSYLSGVSASGLDFSRDGKWVVYVSYPDGAMWRSRVDGSEKQQLLDGSLNGFLPRWSPDGKKVAFTGRKPGENWKVYVIPADGGSPQPIDDSTDKEFDPTWSADGNSIALGGHYGDVGATIRIVNLNTHKVTDLPDSKGLFSPRWSPDGRYIAASVNHGPQGNLMLYEFRTGKWTQLAHGHAYGWHNWSHDGRYVHFSDPLEKRPGVPFYRVRVPDGKLERIAVANFSHGIADAGGWWTGLAPGDAPICLRDTSVQEIYALELERD